MRYRAVALAIFFIVASLAFGVSSAAAWENGGGPDGKNEFGTHDWVLDNAIEIAGAKGSWVDYSTALLASDDPDDRDDPANEITFHLFRAPYGSRGAAQEVADQYYQAVVAYRRGDRRDASYHLGILSHYYADICNPFHTHYDAIGQGSLHSLYESKIGALTTSPGARAAWAEPRSLKTLSDVRKKTVNAAAYSRAKYPELVSDLKADRSVADITDAVLTRASNDLADIVAAIPADAGLAPVPTTFKAYMYRYYPARNGKACIKVKCLDAGGDPLEGVRARISWPTKDGTKYYRVYTGSNGVADVWVNTGDVPLMVKTPVTVISTTSGVTSTTSTWFMATPKLADGREGIKTYLSDHSPKQYTDVTVKTVVHNTAGNPVEDLPVTFYWKHKTKTLTYKVYTNSSGVAKMTRNIGGSPKGYRVYVRAQTQAAGINRSSTSSFVPW